MSSRRRMMSMSRLGLVALVFSLSCSQPPPPPPAAPALAPTRGYLLISLDTLRADHLGCFGYDRDTSPFLDSLARRGVLFENAWVQLPGTLPSHMSIFTGLYPAEHGVYPPDRVLSPEIPTLPELFHQAGFSTAGFTEGGYTSGSYGFARGFDHFQDEVARDPRAVETTLARGLEFLSGLAPDEPFFLFLHTYAVHDPYDPPEPYRSSYLEGEPPDTFEPTGPNLVEVNRSLRTISPREVEYFRALYDGGIRYLDDRLAELFATLEEKGLLDETTVIVTADHGEEFLEHGRMVHEQVYPETLHVPLIVLHPQLQGGRRIASLVESIDIAPTLWTLARIALPEKISGKSFDALLEDERGTLRTEAYAEMADGSARTLLEKRGGRLWQHLRHQPLPEGNAGVWVSDGIRFEHPEPDLELELLAYHRDRQVEVAVDGKSLTTLPVTTGWGRWQLDLPPAKGKRVVSLKADGCDSPAQLGESEDERCLAFRIKNVPLGRTELFDLTADPRARLDLSDQESELNRELFYRLGKLEWEPVAPPGTRDLDQDLEERLEALGYL